MIMSVWFSLLVLATLCGQTNSVLPQISLYQPAVVKPLFDKMQEYGLNAKEQSKKDSGKKQYLVVLLASHDEIMDSSNQEPLETRFNGRLMWIPNKRDSYIEKLFDTERTSHWEARFIYSNMINKFKDVKVSDKLPIVVMYSHYIPCANVNGLGYSCAEELAVFATYNWKKFGLIVAFSEHFVGFTPEDTGTDVQSANHFLQLGGIPSYRYQDDSNNENLVQNNNVENADKSDRWQSVTFLPNFFNFLEDNVQDACLSHTAEERSKIIAYFANYAAYSCFQNMSFCWRAKHANETKDCFNNYIETNIGSDCKQCSKNCAELKKQKIRKCVETSVDNSLVPGQLEEDFNPLKSTWRALNDNNLSRLFRKANQRKIREFGRMVSCKDKSLAPQSLCTKKLSIIV
ncbi:uncharacterized protein LOC112563181 [Pomacea canaliculata]|uniref:uncharacterized protein LOC112563181 n=1 Tax=Pomacea canaliculata TaxID=400727 RepID=UPI000D7331DB|nr:uncharacterized protein LOC112563181 [Pomacea canaliculata]